MRHCCAVLILFPLSIALLGLAGCACGGGVCHPGAAPQPQPALQYIEDVLEAADCALDNLDACLDNAVD